MLSRIERLALLADQAHAQGKLNACVARGDWSVASLQPWLEQGARLSEATPEKTVLEVWAAAMQAALPLPGLTMLWQALEEELGSGWAREHADTLLMATIEQGAPEALAWLLDKQSLDPGVAVWKHALKCGCDDSLDTLLARGGWAVLHQKLLADPDPDLVDPESLMHWARTPHAVVQLQAAGYAVDAKNRHGHSALGEALQRQPLSPTRAQASALVGALLDAGAKRFYPLPHGHGRFHALEALAHRRLDSEADEADTLALLQPFLARPRPEDSAFIPQHLRGGAFLLAQGAPSPLPALSSQWLEAYWHSSDTRNTQRLSVTGDALRALVHHHGLDLQARFDGNTLWQHALHMLKEQPSTHTQAVYLTSVLIEMGQGERAELIAIGGSNATVLANDQALWAEHSAVRLAQSLTSSLSSSSAPAAARRPRL